MIRSSHLLPLLSCSLVMSLALLLGGCAASTTVTTVWETPDRTPLHFTKVLAMVLNASPAERRAGEDELVRRITSAQGIASYTLIPDEDLRDRDKILTAIQGQGFDGAAVIRLVASTDRTTYVPPSYEATYDPFYGGASYSPAPRPGYTITDTTVTTESSLYAVKDHRLLWAGSSSTENPDNIRDLIAQVAQAAAAELKKRGLLQ